MKIWLSLTTRRMDSLCTWRQGINAEFVKEALYRELSNESQHTFWFQPRVMPIFLFFYFDGADKHIVVDWESQGSEISRLLPSLFLLSPSCIYISEILEFRDLEHWEILLMIMQVLICCNEPLYLLIVNERMTNCCNDILI